MDNLCHVSGENGTYKRAAAISRWFVIVHQESVGFEELGHYNVIKFDV